MANYLFKTYFSLTFLYYCSLKQLSSMVSMFPSTMETEVLLYIISTANTQVHIILISCLNCWNNHSIDSPFWPFSKVLAIFRNAARVIQLKLKSDRSFTISSQNPPTEFILFPNKSVNPSNSYKAHAILAQLLCNLISCYSLSCSFCTSYNDVLFLSFKLLKHSPNSYIFISSFSPNKMLFTNICTWHTVPSLLSGLP